MTNYSSLMIYKFIEYIHCINVFCFQNSTNLSLVIKHLTRGCCLYSQRTSLPHPCPPHAEMAPGNKCWGGQKLPECRRRAKGAKFLRAIPRGGYITCRGYGYVPPTWVGFWAQNSLDKGPFFGRFSINMGGFSRNWRKIVKDGWFSAKIHHKSGYDSKFR